MPVPLRSSFAAVLSSVPFLTACFNTVGLVCNLALVWMLLLKCQSPGAQFCNKSGCGPARLTTTIVYTCKSAYSEEKGGSIKLIHDQSKPDMFKCLSMSKTG